MAQSKELTEEVVRDTHKAIRDMLIKYNNPEFGDCIIDEICFQFGFPTTTDIEDV